MPELATASATAPARGLARWGTYLRERFPLHQHAPLVLAFSACAVAYSAHLRGANWPDPRALGVAFGSCLLFFLQLRIADEFKDAAEDARYRPYRPVPRGLVRLRELAVVFALAAAVQLGLALWWSPAQVLVLLVAWLYLAAMSVEFGCRSWLKRHPVVYLWSHMLIMPIVDFYAMACDWVPAAGRPPAGLAAFLAASFANGIVIEVGRKLRDPSREEAGVETYSVLWGPRRAAAVWAGMVLLTAILALLAAWQAAALLAVAAVLLPAAAICVLLAWRFAARLAPGGGARIEVAAGLWTLVLYTSLGLLPGLLAMKG